MSSLPTRLASFVPLFPARTPLPKSATPRRQRSPFRTHAAASAMPAQGAARRGAETAATPERKLPPSPPYPLPPLPKAAPPRYAIAPMMDVTDRHQRALARLISRHATLYTEMVVDRTLIHNELLRALELYVPDGQHPVVLQLGGSEPALLGAAAAMAARHPYTELNLNCGCPSPKVAGKGVFGAALMRDPPLVARCCRAMRESSGLPVTVKCRLGLDDDTSFDSLRRFVDTVWRDGGVTHFIVHARNAILGGLSPAQNRSIPPLRYDAVYRLVDEFPHLRFSINGGIKTVAETRDHLARGVYGVMVGRRVMDAPWRALRDVDAAVYAEHGAEPVSRRDVVAQYLRYARGEAEACGAGTRALVKPLLNLFVGEKNGKMFRRTVDEALRDGVCGIDELVQRALAVVPESVLDERTGSGVFNAENTAAEPAQRPSEKVAVTCGGEAGLTRGSGVL